VNKPNLIEKLLENQAPAEEMQKLIGRLPGNLDETAKQFGAMKRRRKIDSAVGLFLAIAMYVVMEMSQRTLAATFADTAGISDQAWQKKLYSAKIGYPIFCLKQCPNFRQKAKCRLESEQ
jgi:hypothetical protein